MPFVSKKELKKEIDDLIEEIQELKKIVVTDELNYLREQKKLFDEQNKLLSNVHFRVKSVKAFKDETTEQDQVRIIYQLPVVTLTFDENGTPSKDDFFYSVNALQLISLEDIEKLVRCIDSVKKVK